MCRLLGYAAPRPTTVSGLLGGPQSRVFTDMARLHRDGWGTAWQTGAQSIAEERSTEITELGAVVSPDSAFGDPRLGHMLAGEYAASRIVHLRLATDGMACATENTHPFVSDSMAFAHNGSLQPTREIESMISPARRAALVGDTDSERYFAAILSRVDEGASALEATTATATALREAFPTTSLNALLLTPTELIAVHASENVPIPRRAFAASGLAAQELPKHHDDAYYLMRFRRTEDRAVVFASSGLDIAGWEPLPQETVASVDLRTLQLHLAPLGVPDVRSVA